MGIQINGQIDDISATDGGLTISDLEINQSGISTFNAGVNVSGGQLDVGSNIKLGNAGVVTATSLTINDYIYHSGDTNTFIGFESNDTIRFNTNGSDKLKINISGHLILADDNDTYIHHPAADSLAITTGGNERIRIGSNGEILTGGATSEPLYPHYVTARKVQMEIKGAIDVGQTRHHGSLAVNCTNSNSFIGLVRSDNTQTDGTGIGVIGWSGFDGTDYHQAAAIEVVKGAGAGNNDQPGHMIFKTNAGTTSATEILRITSGGNVRHAGANNRMYTFSSDDSAHYIKFNNNLNGLILNGYGGITFETNGPNERLRIASNGDVMIGSGIPSGKLHLGDIGSGDIIAELTSGSPMFTYRNGSSSWMHAGKHPTANEFIISEGASTTSVQMLRILGGGGSTNSKFKFPSVESPIAHGESTADVEIGGRHIWKRLTSSNHVTTATNTNHFYLAFWRTESGNKRTCYYRGVVVNVVASGNYDWSGHGYVTHSSQTILSFNSTTGGVFNAIYNYGFNSIHNTSGGTNMQLHDVAYSYDSTYLYANFRFKTNLSGTGFKPHYNVEVIAPDQITYTCVAF